MARSITVAALSMALEQRHPLTAEQNRRHVDALAAQVSPLRPDLLVLPEIYLTGGLPDRGPAEPQPLDHLQQLAERHHALVAGCLYQERDGRLYNSMVVVAPDGAELGHYDKMHPTEGELGWQITPGALDQAPIDTPLGRIGGQICFDANWPEGWASLAAQGADLILFPSAFAAGRLLTALAATYTVAIVPAIRTLQSGVISNTGEWLARTDRFTAWAAATIDLERTVFHWDEQGHLLPDIVSRYGSRLRVETYGDEAWFVLTPNDHDLTIAEVIAEFDLLTYRQYIARAGAAQDAARSVERG
ncbi:MAG: carbon-nitrogen hydrolase family protein [Chloroflexi bacterium]|nr:carbon-nitrogen hydrolase family protein [Chloroflexota bacterium]